MHTVTVILNHTFDSFNDDIDFDWFEMFRSVYKFSFSLKFSQSSWILSLFNNSHNLFLTPNLLHITNVFNEFNIMTLFICSLITVYIGSFFETVRESALIISFLYFIRISIRIFLSIFASFPIFCILRYT